jgi:hypothetical protein
MAPRDVSWTARLQTALVVLVAVLAWPVVADGGAVQDKSLRPLPHHQELIQYRQARASSAKARSSGSSASKKWSEGDRM